VSPVDDPYVELGVERDASVAEIRRAFRRLALRLHPDRAGVASTEAFQRVSRAYGLLSNPTARAAHDGASRPTTRGGAPAAAFTRPGVVIIARLAAPLRTLVARGVARERPDGVVELLLTTEEARAGGHAALGVPLRVACPTCGGCAAKDRVWCVRCEFEGHIVDDVTALLAIPADVNDGATFTVRLDPEGVVPSLRVCVRLP
jgi:molecular chaperone DnaJ